MKKIDRAEFYQRAEEFIDKLMVEAPVAATQLGDHRFDDRLGDYSEAALERQRWEIREALAEFQSFDTAVFDLDARIDQRLMIQIARSILRDFEKIKTHYRNPGTYSDECLGGIFFSDTGRS